VPHFAICSVGADRPGIVASVTGALLEHGCNLEDTSMTILGGHFAMMLVVEADAGAAELEGALADPAQAFDLTVIVRSIDDDTRRAPSGDPWTASIYGADRPGIVHHVARVLARHSVNIVDLSTRVIGERDRPVYAMVLDLTLPESVDAAEVSAELADLARDLGVECSLHPVEVDIL
jgi:glycine cleavage system transcriptional repressor